MNRQAQLMNEVLERLIMDENLSNETVLIPSMFVEVKQWQNTAPEIPQLEVMRFTKKRVNYGVKYVLPLSLYQQMTTNDPASIERVLGALRSDIDASVRDGTHFPFLLGAVTEVVTPNTSEQTLTIEITRQVTTWKYDPINPVQGE